MTYMIPIGLITLVVGFALGWFICQVKAKADAKAAGGILETARKEAEETLREARVKAQEETFAAREQYDRESKQRRQELLEMEKRIMQRESNLDRKADLLDHKTEEVSRKEVTIVEREKELHKIQAEIDELKRLTQRELERVAILSAEEARKRLLLQAQEDVRAEAAAMTRRIIEEAKHEGDREAKRTITIAIERCASNYMQTATSCTVALPSEEMKGRIIGRGAEYPGDRSRHGHQCAD